MSGVTGVSAGGSYAYDVARTQAAAQQAQQQPKAVTDSDHDGDTDKPGQVDVRA
jgi:hypothetical protein